MNITIVLASAGTTLVISSALVAVSHLVDRSRHAFADGSFSPLAAAFGRG